MNATTPSPRSKARYQITIRMGEKANVVALHETGCCSIGRGSDCAVRVDDAAVSRLHAQLCVQGDSVEVVDLGSSSGTRLARAAGPNAPALVDQRLIAHVPTRLRAGDHLRVGPASIELSRLVGDEPRSAPVALPPGPVPVLVDPVMRDVYDLIARVAARDISVLIQGETGVGKELIARALHRGSPRAHRPFSIVNCAAFPEALLESELFGHEHAALSAAREGETGLLEECAGGTVFLDEIGELPLGMQPKLLRALEERAVWRVGSKRPRPIDVRFVTATNRDLLAGVRTGQFRDDLFYRISGLSVRVPPLRERPSEIEPLARHFIRQLAAQAGEQAPELSEAALAALRRHLWPGNVRELRNVIERAVLVAAAGMIERQHILLDRGAPPVARQGERKALTRVDAKLPSEKGGPLLDERARLIAALDACAGNQRRAAELLGVSRRTLVNRLNKWKLPRPKKLAIHSDD
jgi:two-component system response regulator AtoC